MENKQKTHVASEGLQKKEKNIQDSSDPKLDSMHQDGRDPWSDSPQLGLDSDEVDEMGGDNPTENPE